ncbi:MAG: ABC transporter ATP-binding protein [Candidatus Heimdallarchaeota archaeon]|nr:ABC transporter ATP-binding protein [Candidatus Heimdallarchaeota archaeon]MCK5049873.1 ABC transporter ATP-binding protein [Candidatus Heimdallarchaeota archaeon]
MVREKLIQVKDVVKEFRTGFQMPKLASSFLTSRRFEGKRPKKLRILDGITFNVDEDMNLALLGPNGSGKTTLLKTLATLYMYDEGSIIIDGLEVKDNISQIRKDVAFVSPDMQFLNKLTLKQTLNYFASITGGDPALGTSFLEELGIDQMMNERLESFSVGQKAITRLCIGLQKNPEILFLDEVTSGLDAFRREKVIDFLEKHGREKTIILVDHDAQVLDRICDRVLLLRRGGTIESMVTVKELLNTFDYAYDVAFIPNRRISESEADKIWERHETMGGMYRFFAKDRHELIQIEQNIHDFEDFMEYRVSGISIDDVLLRWLAETTEGDEDLIPVEATEPIEE